MEYVDYLVLGIVAISVLVGAIRGFIREAFSLAVWAAAFLLAFQYSGALSLELEGHVELPSARVAIAFAGLFITVLLVGGLVTWLLGKLVEKTGLSGTDRLLGGIFGGIRGVALVLTLVLVAGFTPLPQDDWWLQSRSIQSLLPLADWSTQFLPDYLLEHLDLYPEPPAGEKTSDGGDTTPAQAWENTGKIPEENPVVV